MEIVKQIYSDRLEEIDLYYGLIDCFDTSESNSDNLKIEVFTNKQLETIVKANALLMLYNLVESTFVNSIEYLYNALRDDGITYSKTSSEIQQIWLNHKFYNAYDKKAHFDTYKNTAVKIVNSIISNAPLELNRRAANVSGNLDADKIRNVCKDHGIPFETPKECHGGQILTKLREQRNQLAHGTISFAECGRELTTTDLYNIKKEVEIFLQGFIRAIEEYYHNKAYLVN